MNKELELEAEKFYKEIIEGEPLTDKIPIYCFIEGATSKYVEKQKLEFAIEQLKYVKTQCYTVRKFRANLLLDGKIRELEQKLKEYDTN